MLYRFFKRLFDIVFGLIGLVLLVPITIVVKIAYMCTGDFHRIFFTQERVGRNGKHFKIIKYRSMAWDAEEQLNELLKKKKYREQWEAYQKIDHDPRITKVGRAIRRGSIDEFPQFINLFLGQMSMVGPRPLVPGELKEHKGKAEIYESVKPGVTGYWAVRGRSNNDYDDRLKMEYYYIENQSILLDIKIILWTFKAVLHQDGAK
ncbi:sugar transferase [Candidatus Saccharibacteria bacterium]|nr:sugar transferase [Candidatus Saccharibacteria bacterium]